MLDENFDIIHYNSVDSTNTLAIDLLSNSSPNAGTVISADYQELGKGQIGRHWHSQKGMNLLFSTILYPTFINPKEQFLLSEVVSLAIVKSLSTLNIEAKIKWPNDIYIHDFKIAGILIQNQLQGKSIKSSVIGIGLNVNQREFPSDIPNPTSLFQILYKSIDRRALLIEILKNLRYYYNRAVLGQAKSISMEYIQNMYKFGVVQKFKGKEVFEGIIQGVNEIGQLQVEVDGVTESFDFRSIQWII